MVGRAIVNCPGCGKERWHGYGRCSSCGGAGTAVETEPRFDPDEIAHEPSCTEWGEPEPSCGCPTFGEVRERSMDVSGLIENIAGPTTPGTTPL